MCLPVGCHVPCTSPKYLHPPAAHPPTPPRPPAPTRLGLTPTPPAPARITQEHAVAGWANVPVALPGKKLSAYPRQLWLEGPRLWPRWSGGAVPGRHRGATRLALVVPVHDGDIKRFGRMLKNWGRLEGNAETAVDTTIRSTASL